MSGAFSFNGTACVQAMQVGERRINAEGGVLGRKLEFVVNDNQTPNHEGNQFLLS